MLFRAKHRFDVPKTRSVAFPKETNRIPFSALRVGPNSVEQDQWHINDVI